MSKILESNYELDLICAAKNGNQSAFGQLYDVYVKKIYDFIYYKTMHRDSAEDITSEVFMKAWKNISQFQGDSLAAWLYSISRNAVIDHYRRQKTTIDIEDCWDLSSESNLLDKTDQSLKMAVIRGALKELSPKEREIIIMRLWLDLSFKEISERLEKQEGAIKMAFKRALVKLKSKVPLAIFMAWPSLLIINGK